MEPSDPLEKEIWRLHQAGDFLKAFELVISGYTPWLRSWLRRKIRDEQRAKDFYQDITVKFWRGFKSFRWGSTSKTWLCAIAIRELYYDARKNAPTEQALDSQAPAVQSSLGGKLDKRAQLEKIFETMTYEERLLLTMRQVHGASWEELVALQDPSKNFTPDELQKLAARLRQQHSRLLKRLRDEVQNEEPTESPNITDEDLRVMAD
jgi:RNA polymerase sigma factor (sigma-70 family)